MEESANDATRIDPYKNFKFRLKWDNAYVAGISEVSELRRNTNVIRHRDGGDPIVLHPSPGQSTSDPITLRRGVTHDTEFQQWANKLWDYQNSTKNPDEANRIVSLKDFRKDFILERYNEAGQKVIAYKLYGCSVSEYVAMPEIDANGGGAIAIESLTLALESWERDTNDKEATDLSFTQPSS